MIGEEKKGVLYTCPLLNNKCLGKGDCRLWVEVKIEGKNPIEGCAIAIIAAAQVAMMEGKS